MKKVLLMFALGAMILGTKAQVKVLNDGKLFLDAVGTLDGWSSSYLQWRGHHLIMGSPVGNYYHNSLNLMPGGATQGSLYSQFRMYTATGVNQHVLRVQIISDGNTYFNTPGNFGIGTNNPLYKLDVRGDVCFGKWDATWEAIRITWTNQWGAPQLYVPSANFVIGSTTYPVNQFHGTWCYIRNIINTSDERLKKNILPIGSSLNRICKLQGKSYDFIDSGDSKIMRSKQNQERKSFGFIAQEMEMIFPELVYSPDSVANYYGINYIGLIPVLVEAIKEQQVIIENLQQKAESRDKALQQEIETLRNALIACCNSKIQKSMQEFDLTGSEEVSTEELKVYQNTPNPFNETTIISCYIPENIKKAELCIYDMTGSRLKCLTVTERGTTSIQIQAGQLAAGVYTYLLIGDGKASEAKQMILTK